VGSQDKTFVTVDANQWNAMDQKEKLDYMRDQVWREGLVELKFEKV
jgi:hypothetical protein